MLDIVVGTQYGDEGKGRVVHNLALNGHYLAAVRAQGGNNAGHTVVHENVTYKLNLLPTSVLVGKPGFLGRGMVLDLDVLVKEISGLKEKGIHPSLRIDSRAHVIMPWHKDLDSLNEKGNGSYAAGSTGRGIGPVYGSKHDRTGVRLADFFDDSARVEALVQKYATRVAYESEQDYSSLVDRYTVEIRTLVDKTKFLTDSLCDVSQEIYDDLILGNNILGECAQAEMLDVDGPYYPRGTSSGTSAVAFWNGIGVYPKKEFAGKVIGVAKAYTTRVGKGPFVTEIEGSFADDIRERGGEYGTTTGRARRVGWLDLPMIKHSLVSSGLDSLAITKIDILGGMDEIPVAVYYKNGNKIPCLNYEKKIPVYETMLGWPAFTTKDYRRQFENGIDYIPNISLREYLQKIEREVGVPIKIITFGQDSKAFISYM
ncbi:MAG: adenylosuccinate synthetase [bacterium]|nr:adenylosuccinate synthetase [bacterium]